MRFHAGRPTLGQVLKWRIQLGRMERCPYCDKPVTRTRALEVDRAWKQHLNYCAPYQERTFGNDGGWINELLQ